MACYVMKVNRYAVKDKTVEQNRYFTVETYSGDVTAYTEQDNYKAAINDIDTACWVWQFAESKEQAISQHYRKHYAAMEYFYRYNRG